MSADKTKCSLCGQEVPRSSLHVHQKTETKQIIDYTISMIKSRHPEWTEGDASCQKCWNFYKQL